MQLVPNFSFCISIDDGAGTYCVEVATSWHSSSSLLIFTKAINTSKYHFSDTVLKFGFGLHEHSITTHCFHFANICLFVEHIFMTIMQILHKAKSRWIRKDINLCQISSTILVLSYIIKFLNAVLYAKIRLKVCTGFCCCKLERTFA